MGTMRTADLRARVTKGAAYLDDEHPGWAEKINLATVDLGSNINCVLGQVQTADGQSGGYAAYLAQHRLGFMWAVALGFDSSYYDKWHPWWAFWAVPTHQGLIEKLADLWRVEIKRRRK